MLHKCLLTESEIKKLRAFINKAVNEKMDIKDVYSLKPVVISAAKKGFSKENLQKLGGDDLIVNDVNIENTKVGFDVYVDLNKDKTQMIRVIVKNSFDDEGQKVLNVYEYWDKFTGKYDDALAFQVTSKWVYKTWGIFRERYQTIDELEKAVEISVFQV